MTQVVFAEEINPVTIRLYIQTTEPGFEPRSCTTTRLQGRTAAGTHVLIDCVQRDGSDGVNVYMADVSQLDHNSNSIELIPAASRGIAIDHSASITARMPYILPQAKSLDVVPQAGAATSSSSDDGGGSKDLQCSSSTLSPSQSAFDSPYSPGRESFRINILV